MKIHKINQNTIDIFLNFNTLPTGYEESCWIRLHKSKEHPGKWRQIAGIKLPSYKYQTLLKELQTNTFTK